MNILPYQSEDAKWLSGNRRALLANDPGTGKTATAIVAMQQAGFEHVLVVCPAIARSVWERELKIWTARKWEVYRVNSPSDPMPLLLDVPTLVIIGYDLFSRKEKGEHSKVYNRIAKNARNPVFDLMICDESHYLKEMTSNRTKEVYGLVKTGKVKNVWLLTGTPAPNHYGELYPMFRYLWPDRISDHKGVPMGREQFENKFCHIKEFQVNGHRVKSISGSKGGTEIKGMLAGVMSRRRFSDVVKDLPVIRIETLPLTMAKIPLPGVVRGMDVYLKGTKTDDEMLKKFQMMSKDVMVASARRQLGLLKVDALTDYVADMLDNDPARKLVIFAWHHEVLDKIMERYAGWKPVLVDGRVSDKDRDARVIEFQTNPKTRIFVGQVLAAGTAITLTAAHDVLFVESSWVPGENYQAAMRCQRLGQKSGVLAVHACIEDTYDQLVADILARKEADLAQVFG